MGLFLTIFGDIAREVRVWRRTPGTRVKGRAVEDAEGFFTVKAVIQPVKPEDLEMLPEGTKTSDARVFHTEKKLSVGSAPDGSPPDVVEDCGERWEIHDASTWAEFADFYRAIGVKEGQ